MVGTPSPKVENDGDSDFNNADNRTEDTDFLDHESFSEKDTESEEDGDSGNEEVNDSEGFSSKEYSGGKQNLCRIFVLVVIILCRAYLEQKVVQQNKDVAIPVKSWELFTLTRYS
ncbi:hypothetical protein AVEN_156892-1 [Araneus ventricosus]|uniref:Uncharacterized protein n=1 Tax=Araneus ventricosus TaxID=182803 RepID=A0A4Y2ENY3_ARAVE|nr:hypothetical protein AVEN_156892-1 [Araneus ventricosus]